MPAVLHQRLVRFCIDSEPRSLPEVRAVGSGRSNNARTQKAPTCQTWKQSQARSTKSIARKSEESRSTATRSRSGKSSAQTRQSKSRVMRGLQSHTKHSTAAADWGGAGAKTSAPNRRAKSNAG